jgi:hypothetical protein
MGVCCCWLLGAVCAVSGVGSADSLTVQQTHMQCCVARSAAQRSSLALTPRLSHNACCTLWTRAACAPPQNLKRLLGVTGNEVVPAAAGGVHSDDDMDDDADGDY